MLLLQVLQRGPAVVDTLLVAAALPDIAVLAANRTDAEAALAAYLLHGQGEQDVLPQDIVQFYSSALIKSDLALGGGDGYLLASFAELGRTVEEIEGGLERKPRLVEAAVAFALHLHPHVTLHTDLAKRVDQQLGRTLGFEWGHLAQRFIAEIDFSGRDGYAEARLPELQFFYAEKHDGLLFRRRSKNSSIAAGRACLAGISSGRTGFECRGPVPENHSLR